MSARQLQLDVHNKLIVDLFAGGGGMSVAFEMAWGRSPDIAINHNEDALSMHRMNHPQTRHFIADVFEVDPRGATQGRPVGWLHGSPDCTHHSQAAGGQPRSKKIRGLGWVMIRWAGQVFPDAISGENVKQMLQWGPLIAKRCKKTGRVMKLDGTVAEPGERVPVQEQFLIPDPKRQGQTWRKFVRCFEALGYEVQWRIICAADFGGHTTRERLFWIARRDGQPIQWAEPTHFKNPKPGQRKWLGAHECIDFSLECPSIFTRKKPLADNTHRRIAKGIEKFVLNNADPFIVPIAHYNGSVQVRSVRDPAGVIMAATKGGEMALAAPTLAIFRGESAGRSVAGPAPTVTAGGDMARDAGAAHALGVVTPILMATDNHQSNGHLNRSVEEPNRTATGSGGIALVAPALMPATHHGSDRVQSLKDGAPTVTGANRGELMLSAPVLVQSGYGEREGQAPRALDIMAPSGAVVAQNVKQALGVAFLAQHNNHRGTEPNPGRNVMEPASTVTGASTGGNQQGLAVAHLEILRNNQEGADVTGPAATVATSGAHHGLVESFLTEYDLPGESGLSPEHEAGALRVAAFLMKYHGSGGQWSNPNGPASTATTKDRLALVTVTIKGHPYVIVDIGLRMIKPPELYRFQDFPANYIIDRGHDGRKFTVTQQVRMVGNSVDPMAPVPFLRLNKPEMAVRKAA